MSLQIDNENGIPTQVVEVAHSAFPSGNIYMTLREEFGTIFQDEQFQELYPRRGQPAETPWRLALITLMQFREDLTDRQAAEAVRTRVDWKYLLCLSLTDGGFHYSILSEFRTCLIEGKMEQVVFEKLLDLFRKKDLLKGHHQQRTDSTHVLGAIRAINRVELVGEMMRCVLNTIAITASDWLRGISQPDWIDRYENRFDDARLPKSATEREVLAEQVGADGQLLFDAVFGQTAPNWLRELPVMKTFWRVWIQNFTWREDGRLRWGQDHEIPPSSLFISSPYDEEAHYSKKRTTSWIGYKVHLTETCTDDAPHLITNVETISSTIPDSERTLAIQKELQAKNMLPETHLVDLGYIDAGILATSQDEFGIDLVGPAKGDYRWQARAGEGFAAENFQIDWQQKRAICPAKKESSSWTPALDARKQEVIKIKFSRKDCLPCPLRPKCTRAKKSPRCTITLRAERQYQAQQMAREREKTDAFKKLYARRAGVEGTISQGVRAFDLRRSRYIGLAKTHLQHVLIAIGMNLVRIVRWLSGEKLAATRQSPFVKLYQPV